MRTLLIILTIAIGALINAEPGLAQTMQFSVYHNWWISSDGSFNYDSSTYDQSTCSTHSNYAVTASLYSPDGRQASATSSGLYSNIINIPLTARV